MVTVPPDIIHLTGLLAFAVGLNRKGKRTGSIEKTVLMWSRFYGTNTSTRTHVRQGPVSVGEGSRHSLLTGLWASQTTDGAKWLSLVAVTRVRSQASELSSKRVTATDCVTISAHNPYADNPLNSHLCANQGVSRLCGWIF